MLPAHETKHVPLLRVPFPSHTFELAQSASAESNGTALWLCGQVLALYVLAEYPAPAAAPAPRTSQPGTGATRSTAQLGRRRRACELGSGTGLTTLALASQGWDVLASDVPFIASGVLSTNIAHNLARARPDWGAVEVQAVDWREPLDCALWALGPPYDLILSADTVYHPSLVGPLLDTLASLARLSTPLGKTRSCPVLLCLERRDPALVDEALREAKARFAGRRVGQGSLRKAVARGGGMQGDWEGVELWRFTLLREGEGEGG
ncbi:hypothetical protein CALCODRAFT_492456 [Calocera cornea HHB12733]|uniref:Uncharacterized protein n=1 Tax=Calocera cornea HHB12733 TaxID=1353952 RepID=A0A165ID24_9BASI|nr:hypothetical protein CALCODRAFT_492456 [Calocera cornea HHB12733]